MVILITGQSFPPSLTFLRFSRLSSSCSSLGIGSLKRKRPDSCAQRRGMRCFETVTPLGTQNETATCHLRDVGRHRHHVCHFRWMAARASGSNPDRKSSHRPSRSTGHLCERFGRKCPRLVVSNPKSSRRCLTSARYSRESFKHD